MPLSAAKSETSCDSFQFRDPFGLCGQAINLTGIQRHLAARFRIQALQSHTSQDIETRVKYWGGKHIQKPRFQQQENMTSFRYSPV